MAKAALEDNPDTLERILNILNDRERKPITRSISLSSSPSPESATDITIQLPDVPTLKSRLCKKGLHDYAKALEPSIMSVTNDTVSLELLMEKLQPIVTNYHNYLVIMKKDHKDQMLQRHNQTFLNLLLQDHPNLKINLTFLKNF